MSDASLSCSLTEVRTFCSNGECSKDPSNRDRIICVCPSGKMYNDGLRRCEGKPHTQSLSLFTDFQGLHWSALVCIKMDIQPRCFQLRNVIPKVIQRDSIKLLYQIHHSCLTFEKKSTKCIRNRGKYKRLKFVNSTQPAGGRPKYPRWTDL